MSVLPTDAKERKALPLWTFLMEYFPLTFVELVRIAVAGDKQHLNNDGSGKIRWAREKSTDQLNTAMRHQFDYGCGVKRDTDGRSHLGKAIWRLCAQSEIDLEAEAVPPGGPVLRLFSKPRQMYSGENTYAALCRYCGNEQSAHSWPELYCKPIEQETNT